MLFDFLPPTIRRRQALTIVTTMMTWALRDSRRNAREAGSK